MSVPVYWMTAKAGIDSSGPWDTRILDRLFEGRLWPFTYQWDFEHRRNVRTIDDGGHEAAIVVVPARHHAQGSDIQWLNDELRKLTSVLVILAGDEEGVFPWRHIIHPDARIWVQHPSVEKHHDMGWAFFYGCGSPVDFDGMELPDKNLGWMFAGQVTHPVRRAARDGLMRASGRVPGFLYETASFAGGMGQDEYARKLMAAKVAPAPSGPQTPDTFRFYEALEAGCWPLVDPQPPYRQPGYWELVYGQDFPFTQINDWDAVGGFIEGIVQQWPEPGNRAMAWWQNQKRTIARRLEQELLHMKCAAPRPWFRDVTVVATVSPIPSHPSGAMLAETLNSIYESMGATPETVVVCDGVRAQQEDMRPAYEEFKRGLCWDALHGDPGTLPLLLEQHHHQIRATQAAMAKVDTPLILFVEHDTPFNRDLIDWETAVDAVAYGGLDVLRFHHESEILPTHQYLMIDQRPVSLFGLPIQRTRQWSARPHLARSDYYRSMLENLTHRENNGFVEDCQYSVASQSPRDHRIGIYAPSGGICRTYHLDGRAGGPKFDDRMMR